MNYILLIIIVIIIVLIIKKTSEKFCVDSAVGDRREWEGYYNTSHPENSVYKDSFKDFLEKVDEDKVENHSVLGSIQNPMSDRNHNTRILYQSGEDVYKF